MVILDIQFWNLKLQNIFRFVNAVLYVLFARVLLEQEDQRDVRERRELR